ncbi:MAG: hypothetical protein IPM69_15115 [Ignavibacteria bacterium]|nr:hypothetical protein [Ignavibacteria bacterium]
MKKQSLFVKRVIVINSVLLLFVQFSCTKEIPARKESNEIQQDYPVELQLIRAGSFSDTRLKSLSDSVTLGFHNFSLYDTCIVNFIDTSFSPQKTISIASTKDTTIQVSLNSLVFIEYIFRNKKIFIYDRYTGLDYPYIYVALLNNYTEEKCFRVTLSNTPLHNHEIG